MYGELILLLKQKHPARGGRLCRPGYDRSGPARRTGQNSKFAS